MAWITTFLLLPLSITFIVSAIIGAVMFVLDIWKWSRRPEKFEDIQKDLSPKKDKSNDNENIDDFL